MQLQQLDKEKVKWRVLGGSTLNKGIRKAFLGRCHLSKHLTEKREHVTRISGKVLQKMNGPQQSLTTAH